MGVGARRRCGGGPVLFAVLFSLTAGAAEREADAPGADDFDQIEEEGLSISGRVIARATSDEREAWRRELALPSARVGLSAAMKHAQAQISADLASKGLLKDAFVRVHDERERFRLYGGQFKAPFSQRELISSWDLLLPARGLVNDFLIESNQLGGRRLGAMGELKLEQAIGLKVSAGVFQGARDELGDRMGEDVAARASVKPWKRLQLGVSGYRPAVFEGDRRWAAGADATVKVAGARLTAEVLAGKLALADFRAATLLASYEVERGSMSIEPLIAGEAIALTGAIAGTGWGASTGAQLTWSKRVKLQLLGERSFEPGDGRPANRAWVQLGARF